MGDRQGYYLLGVSPSDWRILTYSCAKSDVGQGASWITRKSEYTSHSRVLEEMQKHAGVSPARDPFFRRKIGRGAGGRSA